MKNITIFTHPVVSFAEPNVFNFDHKEDEIVLEFEHTGILYAKAFSNEYADREAPNKIVFQEDNPNDFIIFSFASLYIRGYMALPFVLMLIIFATFLTDMQTFKKIDVNDL